MGSKAPKIAPNEKHEFYSLYGLEQKKGHWLVDKSKSRRREEEEQREKKGKTLRLFLGMYIMT